MLFLCCACFFVCVCVCWLLLRRFRFLLLFHGTMCSVVRASARVLDLLKSTSTRVLINGSTFRAERSCRHNSRCAHLGDNSLGCRASGIWRIYEPCNCIEIVCRATLRTQTHILIHTHSQTFTQTQRFTRLTDSAKNSPKTHWQHYNFEKGEGRRII